MKESLSVGENGMYFDHKCVSMIRFLVIPLYIHILLSLLVPQSWKS